MKKSFKKLTLNKITISNLNSLEMESRIGGGEKNPKPPTSMNSCTISDCGTRMCFTVGFTYNPCEPLKIK